MTRRVAANAAVLAALKIAAPALSLLLVLAVSRRLGVEGLGRYSLAYIYLTLFGLLGPLGLHALLTREGARDRRRLPTLLSSAVVVGGGASFVLTFGMIALSRSIGYDGETVRALAIAGLALVPSTCLTYFEAAFVALERTTPMAAASLVEHAFKVGLGVALLLAGQGLDSVLLCALAGKAAACVFCWIWLQRLGVGFSIKTDLEQLSSMAAQAPVFALSAVCATLYWRVDVFLLSWLRGVTEVGQYTAAYRVLDAAILLPQSLCHALYPRLAACSVEPAAAQRWLVALTAPAALVIAVAAGPLLRILYGQRFSEAGPALSILIWTAVPYAWNRYHAYVLVAANRQRADLNINAALLAINVALNLMAIPRYGSTGAACVTLATAVLYGAAQGCYLSRPKFQRTLWKSSVLIFHPFAIWPRSGSARPSGRGSIPKF